MPATVDFDRTPVVPIDPDWDRRPQVCDWDAIEQHRRVHPQDLLLVDWYLGDRRDFVQCDGNPS